MEYRGKLYGKIGSKHFDTGKTTEDWDDLLEALQVVYSKMNAETFSEKHFELVEKAIEKALK